MVEVPRELPKCELLRVLDEKINQRQDTNFDFFGVLENFRKRVSEEVRQINQLFPEYTPHDEQYHLKNLFFIADNILGKDLIKEMKASELFVLAVALYGHDWGMAVNDAEKRYIIFNESSQDAKKNDLWVLPDDRDRFLKFYQDQRLEDSKDIPIEIWREYIRRTHAFRSGERIRRFFEPIDGGVAIAASRICEGHAVDFEELQIYDRYPMNFSVLHENINLRALTVYLRLIDLFDLGEDRTPYVIWKFVAPKDSRSRMEWKKHRALRPVTFQPYQKGRAIHVDGSTDNHEVYYELEDLRLFCEEQLRGCNDTLARMNDPRHKLDIYNIEWNVESTGFEKFLVRFEFERKRMLEILSKEIYQGDPYVFLRELLQNSIDAIRMRREVLERELGSAPAKIGVIRVEVNHLANGDAIVSWNDDGIGMDKYIIKNYLAVAGRSYYLSKDFEKIGLRMDPISKFGIGILSCFMVADRIEIETCKGPYLHMQSEPLKITIPDPLQLFRIETLPTTCAKVGTTVRVFIDGKKIVDEEEKPLESLKITEYLSEIAGFVEFPIIVSEGDAKTIILHPKQDENAAIQTFGNQFEVKQLDLTFPWSEAFLPQDVHIASEIFEEKRIDIARDLSLKGCEGVITFPVPIDDSTDTSHGSEIIFWSQDKNENRTRVRLGSDWNGYYKGGSSLSRSAYHANKYAVYVNGILLPRASIPGIFMDDRLDQFTEPKILINFTNKNAPKIDLARTQLSGRSNHWYQPLYESYIKYIKETFLDKLLDLDTFERLYQMSRIILFYNVHSYDLWQFFPHEHWPLLFLQGGNLTCLEWGAISSEQIFGSPIPLENTMNIPFLSDWLAQKNYSGHICNWSGDKFLVKHENIFGSSQATNIAERLCWLPIWKTHNFSAIRFLTPPWEGVPSLVQRIYIPNKECEPIQEVELILERAIKDPLSLSPIEIRLISQYMRNMSGKTLPEIINFPKPFNESFAYGWHFLNAEHHVTQALIRLTAAFVSASMNKTLSAERIGKMSDALKSFHTADKYFLGNWKQFNSNFRYLWLKAREINLIKIERIEELMPTKDNFVPGTILDSNNLGRMELISQALKDVEKVPPFGQPLI